MRIAISTIADCMFSQAMSQIKNIKITDAKPSAI